MEYPAEDVISSFEVVSDIKSQVKGMIEIYYRHVLPNHKDRFVIGGIKENNVIIIDSAGMPAFG